MTEYIVARRMQDGFGYALLDAEQKYLGFALTLSLAQRFALLSRATLIIEY